MRLSQCPECHSSNIKFYEVRNSYNCIDCGCSFSEKEINKLRIFLSYGHDDNEELVRLIKTDLEKRGHDVWFDKNEIKFGDEWRRSITDGILGSNRVLSFLSKYSTRDPGVCRDEIAIAIGVKGGNIQTILVESEQEVRPPVSIGHIQWLDMHDWQEKRTDDGAAWEPWYQTKLAEIISVVESDESRRFAGEIEKLNDYLKPIKSDSRISGLLSKGFYGREWLFDAVENWRQDTTHDSRLFWIMGDPGVGKSAFAAQLTHTHGDTVIAAQFCEWDKPDHRDARRVVCSIAFQLATRLPDYRKLLLTLPEIKELDRKDASELFDYLLANPLKSIINGGRERHLIVIDALDEAGESGRNPLVEMLARNAHHLPEWLGIVVTSRPEFDVKTPFQALNPFPLDTKSESNRADIRDYMESKLALLLQNRPNSEKLIAQILEKSEGVFLYVERFCDDVQQKHISLDLPDQFPQGLGGIFAQYFQRQFPDLEKFSKEIRPALRAILASREPLPLEILQKLLNWEDEELRDFTHILGSLFSVTKDTDTETIKPYHKSLADWLGDESKAGRYFVSELEGHRILSEFCLLEWKNISIFPISHTIYHTVLAKKNEDVIELLLNTDFQNEKVCKCGGIKLCEDFEFAEKYLNEGLGLCGAACFLLHGFSSDIMERGAIYLDSNDNQKWRSRDMRESLFKEACFATIQWKRQGLLKYACTLFAIEALSVSNWKFELVNQAIESLRILLGGTNNFVERKELQTTIYSNVIRARNAPRKIINYSRFVANTAHLYHDYEEKILSAAYAALSFEMLSVLRNIWYACGYNAVFECDGDPAGAPGIAWNDVQDELWSKMPVLIEKILKMDKIIQNQQ
jgi:hypothetical protein